MMILDVLPGFVPTEALFLGTLALVVFVVLMNRGVWWVVNIMAQKEPALMAVGVFLVALHANPLSMAFGVLLVGLGAAIYVHPEWDL